MDREMTAVPRASYGEDNVRELGEITDQLGTLEVLLEELDSRVGSFTRFIQSILRPVGPCAEGAELKSMQREVSPLAERLRSANFRVRSISENITELHERAEL